MEDTPPSKMVRIPTPLVPAVQSLNKLYRQGHGLTLVNALEEWLNAIEKGETVTPQTVIRDDSDLLADVIARLERLESAQDAETLTQLTQRVSLLENAMDELSSVVVEALRNKRQSLNGKPASENASEAIAEETLEPEGDAESASDTDNKTLATATPTLPPNLKPPLTQTALAERLGQPYPYYVKKHRERGKAHFEVWSRSVDPDGLTWTFDEPKRRGSVRSKALKFYPKL